MTTQDIINRLIADLSAQLPQWYSELEPICSDKFNNHTDWQPISPFHHPLDCDWATYINIGWLREDDFFDSIEDVIRFNLYQSFAFSFVRMQPQRFDIPFDKCQLALSQAISQQQISPIIVNFGVDLYALGENSGIVYDSTKNNWSFKGHPIYEYPYTSITKQIDRSFFILSKQDAPFINFLKDRHMDLSTFGSLPTTDINHSAEIAIYTKDNGTTYNPYFCVNHLIPILCKRNTTAIQLYINEYEFERELGIHLHWNQ